MKLKTNIGLVPLHSINLHLPHPLQTCLPPRSISPRTVSPTHTTSYLASSSLPSIQPWSTGNRMPGVNAPCWGGGSRYSAVIGPRCPLLGERVQTLSWGSLLGDVALIKTQFRDGSSFIEPINPQLSQSDLISLEWNSLRVCESPLTWRFLWVLSCWSLIIWSSLLDLKLSRRAFYFLVFYLLSQETHVKLTTKVNLNPQNRVKLHTFVLLNFWNKPGYLPPTNMWLHICVLRMDVSWKLTPDFLEHSDELLCLLCSHEDRSLLYWESRERLKIHQFNHRLQLVTLRAAQYQSATGSTGSYQVQPEPVFILWFKTTPVIWLKVQLCGRYIALYQLHTKNN